MRKVLLSLTEEQVKSLIDAVSKDDAGRPQYGDTHKSKARELLRAKVLVALEGSDDSEGVE